MKQHDTRHAGCMAEPTRSRVAFHVASTNQLSAFRYVNPLLGQQIANTLCMMHTAMLSTLLVL